MGRVSAKEDFHFCQLQQTIVERETELGFKLLLKIHSLDPESSNNFIKILILGAVFLGEGLIGMVIKGLKFILTEGFPCILNQFFFL